MIRERVVKAGDGMKKTVRIWHAMKMRHAALTALRWESGAAELMFGSPVKISHNRLDNGLLIDVPRFPVFVLGF